MTAAIIITICVLLLIAYIFDLSSSVTKIPSVILLLILGWLAKQISLLIDIHIPNLTPLLPIFGTIGLIMIVLEGSLELELQLSKKNIILSTFFTALIPMLIQAFLLAYLFYYFGNTDFKTGLANAIPLCVISSSIAIPSAIHFSGANKEFIIYESSFSDIIGILFFNFVTLNATIGVNSFTHFIFELLLIIVISFIATILLSFFLSKIEHHIKFVPIILLIILIYVISKEYHLPALIFIVLFGLFLGNIDRLKKYPWIKRLHTGTMQKELNKFKELSSEATFLIRSLFFILFGYLIDTNELLNTETLAWSVVIVVMILCLRWIILKLMRLPIQPLLYIAPRGLITILLFLSLLPSDNISIVSRSLITQVIIITTLLMTIGNLKKKEKKETPEQEVITNPVGIPFDEGNQPDIAS